jgi:hypothetical protein
MLAAIRRASVAREQCFFLEIDVRQALDNAIHDLLPA